MINRGALVWVRADLRQRWRGVVFLALLAGIGFGIVLAAVACAMRTDSALERAIEDRAVADAIIQLNTPEAAAAVLDQPGVAEGALADMYLGQLDGVEFDAAAVVVHGGWGSTFDSIELIAGRHADPSAPHEVVVPSATAAEADVNVGDTITLHTLSPAQADQYLGIEGADPAALGKPGPVVDLEVVGIGGTLTNLIETEESFIYATPAFGDRYRTAVGHFGVDGIGGGFAAVRLRNGQDDLAAFTASLQAALGVDEASEDFSVQSRSGTMENVEAAISTTTSGVLIFAAVAAIAGIAALGQAVGRHLSRSQGEQATLSALGLKRSDRAEALALGLVPVAIGAALIAGVVVVLASAVTPFGVARRFDPDLGIRPEFAVAGGGAVAVAVVVIILGAIRSWRATSPASERATARPSAATSFAVRAGATPVMTTGVRLAFDRGRGRRITHSRSAMTSAVLGVTAIAGALSYTASLHRTLTDPVRWGWAWDVVVDVAPERFDEAVSALTALDEVSGLATVTDRQVVVDGLVVRGQSFEVHRGHVPAVVHAGRVPGGPGEIALGTAVSRRLDRDVGDTVTVSTAAGPRELTVVGRITSYPIDSNGPGDAVLLDPKGLEAVASSEGFASVAVTADTGTSTEQLVAALQSLVDDDVVELSVYSYPHVPDKVANASPVRAVAWALVAFVAALAVVGAAHAVHVTMGRRRDELAVLRALGFRPADVRTSSAWLGVCIAACALAVGVPLGVVAGRLAFRRLTDGIGLEGGFVVPLAEMLLVVVSAMIALQLLTVLPGSRTARMSPADVLRSE